MGRYVGELTATWDDGGRLMQLFHPFSFIDDHELRWDVPAGAQIDGATIPRVLWSVTGSPYEGKYRKASVVHDFYCSVRTRDADATHRMFHEAMLVSGVSAGKAKIMYAAVKYAGPRWTLMDMHNANLASGGRYAEGRDEGWSGDGETGMAECGSGGDGGYGGSGDGGGGSYGGSGEGGGYGLEVVWSPSQVSAGEFAQFAEQVARADMSLADIDRAADRLATCAPVVSDEDYGRFIQSIDNIDDSVRPEER